MDNNLENFIIVGDRVLIKPKTNDKMTKSGLYLPPGVKEKESVQSGYIVKVGPGYPIPIPREEQESWKGNIKEVEYFPLQCREGDLAIYLQKDSYEIEYRQKKYIIVPQHAILLLIRDEDLIE